MIQRIERVHAQTLIIEPPVSPRFTTFISSAKRESAMARIPPLSRETYTHDRGGKPEKSRMKRGPSS